jgi:hypothetical protein
MQVCTELRTPAFDGSRKIVDKRYLVFYPIYIAFITQYYNSRRPVHIRRTERKLVPSKFTYKHTYKEGICLQNIIIGFTMRSFS